VALPSGLEPPVQGEKPTEHRHDQDVKAVQDADDQQNAADPGRLVLQLSCSRLDRPAARALEVNSEQDAGREDQVVDDVGEDDVALAC
jgi:hypothetical protein